MNITRAEIAAALSTIPKVKGHERRPAALRKGDAYPLVGGLERGRGLTFSTTWRIILVLGGDERQADEMLEQLLPDIAVGLQEADVLYVTAATPFIVPTEAGDVYAAEITGRSD